MRTPMFLVTAGNTRELIDRVRDWGNIFTGKTGLDLALTLLDVGDVHLLTSNTQHAAEFAGKTGAVGRLSVETFQRHAELERLLRDNVGRAEGVFMSAAVCDYQPDGAYRIVASEPIPGTHPPQFRWIVEYAHAGKVKSTHTRIAFTGVPTVKLIDQFRGPWGFRGLLVKFKLEVGISETDLVAVAAASRVHSGADWIVANTLEMVQGGNPGAYLIDAAGAVRVPRAAMAIELRERTRAWWHRSAQP